MRQRLVIAIVTLYLASAGVLLISCAPNDPFDPESVPNQPPVVSFFVNPVDPDDELSSTSYFNRTFRWSGTDTDGWVQAYYVSVRTDPAVPAPWDTTTRTDTTMTFTTDVNGEAEATLLIACVDDRGAYSDTLEQYVPLRNFPPSVGFQSDYNPVKNLQVEYIYDGEAVVDTVYWNFGPNLFRMFALDLDGAATMDPYFRYTLMDTEPDVIYETDDPLNDPAADPETAWIQVPFTDTDEIKDFEIYLRSATPGQRTLTVSVGDEAFADTRFTYSWEVRAPAGPVLYIEDNAAPAMKDLTARSLDAIYGEGNWNSYFFPYGVPDSEFILLETMRLFDLLFWTVGNQSSSLVNFATARNGVIEKYLYPELSDNPTADPGQLFMSARGIQILNDAFLQDVLGITPAASPAQGALNIPGGSPALGAAAHLPTMVAAAAQPVGFGIGILDGTEILYNMEYCFRCYNAREPYDPTIAVRRPLRETGLPAQIVIFSVELHEFETDDVLDALDAILVQDMEVTPR